MKSRAADKEAACEGVGGGAGTSRKLASNVYYEYEYLLLLPTYAF